MLLHNTNLTEREAHAKRLHLTLKRFDELVYSANHAFEIMRDLGPFYGKEDIKEPTFRVSAEPVLLPPGSKNKLEKLGNDLFFLGKALKKLPQSVRSILGTQIEFNIPASWRIDAIIDTYGRLYVNEIEGVDSADALMIAEQLAYSLQSINDSTAAKIMLTYKSMCTTKKQFYHIAFIRNLVPHNPHTANHKRFINFLNALSNGEICAELMDESEIRQGITMPVWEHYDGVINHTSFTPLELYAAGIQKQQLFSAGNYNALVNKGVFALLFDRNLRPFWNTNLGEERFTRLIDMLIPTKFIRSLTDLEEAKNMGKVVKVSWADTNLELINRSRGVAIPHDSIAQGQFARWETLRELFKQGNTLIAQDFIMPAKIPSLLRKKGITLEYVEWYNRVCVKYVADSNPNGKIDPQILLTATEVTLGPEVIPAGRSCAFTAGKL